MFEPVLKIFSDHRVSELICSPDATWSSSPGGFARHPPAYSSQDEFLDELFNFCESQSVRLDALSPSAGGLWGGHKFRWHMVIPPLSETPLVCLRRHRFDSITLESFVDEFGCLSSVASELERGASLVISGPTSSGKTSFLAALLARHGLNQRLVILERFAELPLLTSLWTRLTSVPANLRGQGHFSMASLFRESLRLRPDRLVLGELLDDDARILLGALRSGHEGCLATVHAGSISECVDRLEETIERELLSRLDVAFVQLQRPSGGGAPRITDFSRAIPPEGRWI